MLKASIEFVHVWGWYVLFATLQFSVVALVGTLFHRAEWVLDRRYPDDLPLSAGKWSREALSRLGLSDRVWVFTISERTERKGTYSPTLQYVLLDPETFFRRSPVCWALGAHELGHALMYLRAHVVATVMTACKIVMPTLARFGMIFLLVNMFYGSQAIADVAFWLIVGSTACNIVVLVDEAAASLIAMRLLKTDGRFERRHWRVATTFLTSAFASYLGGLIGRLILLAAYGSMSRLVLSQVAFAPSDTLQGSGQVVAIVLSVVLGIIALINVARVLWPRALPPTDVKLCALQRILNGLLLIPLVLLIWDEPGGTGFQISIAMAAGPLVQVCIEVFASVVFLSVLLAYFVKTLGRKEADDDRNVMTITHGMLEREAAIMGLKARFKLQVVGRYSQWFIRWKHLRTLVHLPMLLMFWLAA